MHFKNAAKIFDKDWKKKKKKWQKVKHNKKDNILIISINKTDIFSKTSPNQKDFSSIKYYNYDQKKHYITLYPQM